MASGRDSGLIDLFAIHEASRAAPPPASSDPLPAVSIDDEDLEVMRRAEAKTRLYTKIIGVTAGALLGFGIIALAVGATESTPEAAKTSLAAKAPAPVAAPPVTRTPPAAAPALPPPPAAPAQAPAPTAKAKADGGAAKVAIASASKPAAAKKPGVNAKKSKSPKLQKVQSSGT